MKSYSMQLTSAEPTAVVSAADAGSEYVSVASIGVVADTDSASSVPVVLYVTRAESVTATPAASRALQRADLALVGFVAPAAGAVIVGQFDDDSMLVMENEVAASAGLYVGAAAGSIPSGKVVNVTVNIDWKAQTGAKASEGALTGLTRFLQATACGS